MSNMQATIPSANDRPPIDFKKGVTVTSTPSPPVVYDAKQAMGQLAEHIAEQYPPGEVPDSVKLAQARAAAAQPVHEDPFNPTPEDTPVQPVVQAPAPPPIPMVSVAVPLAQVQAQAQVQAPPPVAITSAPAVAPVTPPPAPVPPAPAVSNPVKEFLDARIRVTLTLQDGTFTMPATAIRETDMSVFVFFPDTPSSMTFVPKPGTELRISVDRGGEYRSWTVYYPGSYVTIGELAQTVVAFIKAED